MAVQIHPTAQVDPKAELAAGVSIGAFAIVEKKVKIGAHTTIGEHTIIRNHTSIGNDNKIYPFCAIGEAPQHLGYKNQPTQLVIGERNIIREYCTLNRGTAATKLGSTVIGCDNFIMAYSHIAHDCTLGDNIIFANGSSLAGHVDIGNYAILGGFTMVHQFCKIGAHCITAIGSVCLSDVPPFVLAAGNTAAPHGLNTKGLRRRGFDDCSIARLKKAYKFLYRSNLDLQSAIGEIEKLAGSEIKMLCDFLRTSKRGIIR